MDSYGDIIKPFRTAISIFITCLLLHPQAWGSLDASLGNANKGPLIKISNLFFLESGIKSQGLHCVSCDTPASLDVSFSECKRCKRHKCSPCIRKLTKDKGNPASTGESNCTSCNNENGFKDVKLSEWRDKFATLHIHCENKEFCSWSMKFETSVSMNNEYEDHFEKCPYTKKACTFCNTTLHNKDFEAHVSNECLKRPVVCSECNKSMCHEELSEHQSVECHIIKLKNIGSTHLSEQEVRELIQESVTIHIRQDENRKKLLHIINQQESKIKELNDQVARMSLEYGELHNQKLIPHEKIIDISAEGMEELLDKENYYKGVSKPFFIKNDWDDFQPARQLVLLVQKITHEKQEASYKISLLVSYLPEETEDDINDIDWNHHENMDVVILNPSQHPSAFKGLARSSDGYHIGRPQITSKHKYNHYQPHYTIQLGQTQDLQQLKKYIHTPDTLPRFRVKTSLPYAPQGTHKLLSEKSRYSPPLEVLASKQLRLTIPARFALGEFNNTPESNPYRKEKSLKFHISDEVWELYIRKINHRPVIAIRLVSYPANEEDYKPVLRTVHTALYSPNLLMYRFPDKYQLAGSPEVQLNDALEKGYGIPLDIDPLHIHQYKIGDNIILQLTINEGSYDTPRIWIPEATSIEAAQKVQHSQSRISTTGLPSRYSNNKMQGIITSDVQHSGTSITWEAPELRLRPQHKVKSPAFTVENMMFYFSLEYSDSGIQSLMLHTTSRFFFFAQAPWRKKLDKIQVFYNRENTTQKRNTISFTEIPDRRGPYTRNRHWAQLRSSKGINLIPVNFSDFNSKSGLKITATFTPEAPQPSANEHTPLLKSMVE